MPLAALVKCEARCSWTGMGFLSFPAQVKESGTDWHSQTGSVMTLFNWELTQGVSDSKLLGSVMTWKETIVLAFPSMDNLVCRSTHLESQPAKTWQASFPRKGIAEFLTSVLSEDNLWNLNPESEMALKLKSVTRGNVKYEGFPM